MAGIKEIYLGFAHEEVNLNDDGKDPNLRLLQIKILRMVNKFLWGRLGLDFRLAHILVHNLPQKKLSFPRKI